MTTRTCFFSSVWRLLMVLMLSLLMAGASAREARATGYVVSNLNDSGAGSLRSAITAANANPGADTITFTVSGTILLASSLPGILDNVTIDGSGRNITINGNDTHRVLYIYENYVVSVISLTIANGKADPGNGGGIANMGTLTVKNSTFIGNSASYNGGAIANWGTLIVTNSTFSGNSVYSSPGRGGSHR